MFAGAAPEGSQQSCSGLSSQSFSCGQRLHNTSLVPAVPLAPGSPLPFPRREFGRLPSILTPPPGLHPRGRMDQEGWEAPGEEQHGYQGWKSASDHLRGQPGAGQLCKFPQGVKVAPYPPTP